MLGMHAVDIVDKRHYAFPRSYLLVIYLVMAVVGCGFSSIASENQRANTKKVPAKPHVLQVTLYRSGDMTGYTRVDLRTRALRVSGHQLGGSGWHRYDTSITPEETRKFIQLVNKVDLRGFQPKSEWFPDHKGLSEGSSYIAIKWDDKETVFRRATADDKKAMPEEAKRYYEAMDGIRSCLAKMELEYKKKVIVTQVKNVEDDPDCREFLDRLDEVFRIALPTPR